MGWVLVTRLAQSGLVLLVVSVLAFAGVFAIGNPVDILISPQATQEEIEATIRALHLDLPLHRQYLMFLDGLARGDFGRSFVFNEPVFALILRRMPATLELAAAAMLLAVSLGLPLGLVAGLRPEAWPGRLIGYLSVLCFSLPSFWVGLMLIVLFSVTAGWLPSTGRGATVPLLGVEVSFLTADGIRHLLLPALNLALFKLALVVRLTAAGVKDNMRMDYVRYARAKGLAWPRIVGVHVLRNILIPLVTVVGLELGGLIAFAVVTETVFAWPGMGKLIIDSINQLDRPVIVAYLMIVAAMFVAINLAIDLLYAVLDPRVRHAAAA
jgi:peptide/nickel transport system permease protein